MMMMLDRSISGINPELNERMRMRAFGSGPVVGGEEQEPQQRHSPEET